MSRTGLLHDAAAFACFENQPMAETRIHGVCMVYLTYALNRWFAKVGRADVHVGMNSFLCLEHGYPRTPVRPDVYVVVGARNDQPDARLPWNERQGPDFVLEVTSTGTRSEDERRKRAVYASLGVREYFAYDPKGECLTPALRGLRLRNGEYRALPAVTVLPGRGVAVTSDVLGLELRDVRETRTLRLRDRATGQDLLTYEESETAREEEAAARHRESRARRVETVARRAAEARVEQEASARRDAEVRVRRLASRLRTLENASAPAGKRRSRKSGR